MEKEAKQSKARKTKQDPGPEAAVMERKQDPIHAHAEVIQNPIPHLPAVTHTPDMLLAMGIEKGMGLDQLEKLMDLQERWLARHAKSAYLQAKSKFQAKCPEIRKVKPVGYNAKDPDAPRVEYDYAPLGHISTVINPILEECGLTYDWKIKDVQRDGKDFIQVTLIVSHIAGHSEYITMEATHDASGKKNAIQARGSTVTYLQRYTLIAGLGLTTADKDDDGRAARSGAPTGQQNQASGKKPAPSPDVFRKLTQRAQAGEDVVAKAQEHFTLTESQVEALNIFYRNSPKRQENDPGDEPAS